MTPPVRWQDSAPSGLVAGRVGVVAAARSVIGTRRRADRDARRKRRAGMRARRVSEVAFENRHLECQLSPSSFGSLRTTTASFTVAPSPLNTEIVALGGSLAKLSLPTTL